MRYLVLLIFISGCAWTPSGPPTCGGEYSKKISEKSDVVVSSVLLKNKKCTKVERFKCGFLYVKPQKNRLQEEGRMRGGNFVLIEKESFGTGIMYDTEYYSAEGEVYRCE